MKKALQLKEFRQQLNLSQFEMAKFLRTTRSQIAMVENGGRSLQIDGAVRLATLFNCATKTPELSKTITLNIAEGTSLIERGQAKGWESRQLKLQYDKLRLQDQLNTMKEEWDANFQLAVTMEQLIQVLDNSQPMDYYWSYTNERMSYAYRKLINCGEAAQQGLQTKIDICNAELSILTNLLSGK